jgi:hypothetical protein
MYTNAAFRFKIAMVLVAGLNIFMLERAVKGSEGKWQEPGRTPSSIRWSAVISILLWFGIVAMSRVIGFTGARE